MASEMQADVTATIKALLAASEAVSEALMFAKTVDIDLNRRMPSLPAQTPTEDQIVAALKADPAMAGRVMAFCGFEFSGSDTAEFGAAASVRADQLYIGNPRRPGLQSLAVALAAASYRG